MKLSKKSTPALKLNKPVSIRVYSNLAISLDGKISSPRRELFSLGSKKDLTLLRTLRDKVGAVLFGAGVLRTYRKACLPRSRKHRVVNAVVSRRLEGLDERWEFFQDKRIDRVFYVTGKISKSVRERFSKVGEIVSISEKKCAREILNDLSKRGIARVALEGGGETMWTFVEANLIEDYYVTLTPLVIGGRSSPTLVDGAGFNPKSILKLKLVGLERYGSEIFLHYQRTPLGGGHPGHGAAIARV